MFDAAATVTNTQWIPWRKQAGLTMLHAIDVNNSTMLAVAKPSIGTMMTTRRMMKRSLIL